MNLPIKHATTINDKLSELTNPKAIDLLTRLYLKVPALSFEVLRVRGDQEATKFQVFHGVDSVGHIDFAYSRQKNGQHTYAVAVGSPYIRKDRAPHHEFVSTNYDTALRKAVEVYSLGPDDESIAKEELEYVKSNVANVLDNAVYKLRANIGHGLKDKEAVELTRYFLNMQLMPEVKHPLPAYAAKFNTDEVKERLNNYEVLSGVATELDRNNGYAVSVARDGSVRAYSYATGKLAYHVKSTYELPEWMQSKFAMLKMLEGTQAINQVGIRIATERFSKHNSEVKYFITDGEMQFDH